MRLRPANRRYCFWIYLEFYEASDLFRSWR